jgi:hypothetical protein
MDDITDTAVETRRDRWGRYLVVPPDGGKPVGYTRATTISKTLDDTSSLMAWGERMTAIGLARRPDILAQIDAELDKNALNKLCTAAKEAGGATIRRDLGTALHSILERSWTEPDYQPPKAHVADVEAVHRALCDAGLSVVDGMNERIVVHDRHKVAGTFDLILMNSAGQRFIADIKTGSSVVYGALGFAVQLGIYATANSLYVQGAAKDGSGDRREPMIDVRQDEAIIIHVEPSSGVCTLHRLALDPSLVELAMTVRAARARKDLIAELDTASSPRDAWVRERIAAILEADKATLVRMWPSGILTPSKHPTPFTDDEIDELLPILEQAETALSVSFPTSDPTTPPPQPRQAATETAAPAVDMPSEGDMLPHLAGVLRERWQNMSDEQQQIVGERVAEAAAAHLPIRVQEMPSERRVNVAAAIFDAIERWPADHVVRLRELLAVVLDDDTALMDTVPLGAVLGLCSHTQARTLAEMVSAGITVESS